MPPDCSALWRQGQIHIGRLVGHYIDFVDTGRPLERAFMVDLLISPDKNNPIPARRNGRHQAHEELHGLAILKIINGSAFNQVGP